MSETAWPNLSKVEEALAKYDAVDRDALWAVADTNEAVKELVLKDRADLLEVQLVFFEATKDRNSRSTCLFVNLEDLRMFVSRWKEKLST